MAEGEPCAASDILAHLKSALHAPVVPDLPSEWESFPELSEIHAYILELRRLLGEFANGDLSRDIHLRGFTAGKLKALQANILHLTWQIQQVANGDFSQRVDFMGDFSKAFNSMVEQLDEALTVLRQKEEELTNLTRALRTEIKHKTRALSALSESEANFRYMAEHDVLTGVLNRRSFYDVALRELERSQMMEAHCSIAIFDIDHFKRFNDTYGHVEGDGALKHVTNTIKSCLRQEDIIARYGGEEFVLLFPLADKTVGRSVAERLRVAVANSPVRMAAGDAGVTVSIGLAHVPPSQDRERDLSFLENVLRHADEALYMAKNQGRNRLVVSDYPETDSASGADATA